MILPVADSRRVALEQDDIKGAYLAQLKVTLADDTEETIRLTDAPFDIVADSLTFLGNGLLGDVRVPKKRGLDTDDATLLLFNPKNDLDYWERKFVNYPKAQMALWSIYLDAADDFTESYAEYVGSCSHVAYSMSNNRVMEVAAQFSGRFAALDDTYAVTCTEANQRRRNKNDSAFKYIHEPPKAAWGRD